MSFCLKCNQSSSITSVFKCAHKFCNKCLRQQFLNGDGSCCINTGCKSVAIDSQIRKVLDEVDYTTYKNKSKKVPGVHKFDPRWICERCTALNLPLIKFCDVCQSNRPEAFIPPTDYVPTKVEKDAVALEKLEMDKEKQRLEEEEERKKEGLQYLRKLSQQEVTMTNEVSECPVCLMDYEAGEAIVLHSCLHTVCKECLKNYLINVDNPKIKCPTENCIGQIEDREIKMMLSSADYEKYNQLSLRTAEATEKLSFHCKGVNCTAWIVHDEGVKSFKCPLCKKQNCITCKVIHEGLDCVGYQRSIVDQSTTANDIYFEKLLKDGLAMICSGCKVLVEKDKGCDWIQCKLCKTELCWATKGPRWGPLGRDDTSGGCRCRVNGKKCHPSCRFCH